MATSVMIIGSGIPMPSPARRHAEMRTVGAPAARAGVAQLVLTHLMPAPRGSDEAAALVADVRSGGYDGDVVVASDLYTAAV